MPKTSQTEGRLTIENLENRQLLAGDVMVEVSRGNLMVVGDEADNHIHISSGHNSGEYVIVGLPSPDGSGTTINGQTEPLVVNDAVRNVRVATGEGRDIVDISNARFRHLAIHTGLGDDVVRLGMAPNRMRPVDPSTTENDNAEEKDPRDPAIQPSVTVHGRLRISTGAGNDIVTERHVRIGHSQTTHTGKGDDRVILAPPSIAPESPEPVKMAEAIDEGNTPPTTPPRGPGAAIQIGRALKIATGAGNDNVRLHATNAGSVNIRTGSGQDAVDLKRVDADRGISLVTNSDADHVTMNQVHSRWAWLKTGANSDQVKIQDSAFAIFGSFLGDGDDGLHLGGTSISRIALLSGGPGTDALLQDAETQPAHIRISGFERPSSHDEEDVSS